MASRFDPRVLDRPPAPPSGPAHEALRRQRAEAILSRHSPEDVIAASVEERRRWVIDAMLRFSDEEKRNV